MYYQLSVLEIFYLFSQLDFVFYANGCIDGAILVNMLVNEQLIAT